MSSADPAVILAKGDIQTPVQTIFYTPMIPYGFRKPFGIAG
jgi:hypothetical protein